MEDKEQVTTEEHDVTPKMGELEESLIRNAKHGAHKGRVCIGSIRRIKTRITFPKLCTASIYK